MFTVESAHAHLTRQFTGTPLKLLETNNPNRTLHDKKSQLTGGSKLTICKRGRGFELRKTENKTNKWPVCDSDALNTRQIRPQYVSLGLELFSHRTFSLIFLLYFSAQIFYPHFDLHLRLQLKSSARYQLSRQSA